MDVKELNFKIEKDNVRADFLLGIYWIAKEHHSILYMGQLVNISLVVPRPSLQYTKSPSSDSNPGPFPLHHYFSA